jgi:hypothetical protein
MPMDFGLIEDPVSDAERKQVASTCVVGLDLPMRAVIDRVDDRVGRLYGGWPDRLWLVAKDGRIAYRSGPGPAGFKPADWEEAIKAELARIRPAK